MQEGWWFVSNAQDLVDAGAQALKMQRTCFRPVSRNKPAAWDKIPDASLLLLFNHTVFTLTRV